MDFSRVLTDEQIARIRAGAEEILATVGFKVRDGEALRRCAAAGAEVDEAAGVVRLSPELLGELLAGVPSRYTIAGVSGQTWEVGGEEQQGIAIVTDPWIVDYERQRPRKPCLEDLRRHTLLAGQLDCVAAVSRMDYPVTDVDGPASTLRAWEQYLLNNGKHHHFMPANRESLEQWRDILGILAGGKDAVGAGLFTIAAAVISPLSISDFNVEVMRFACEYGAAVVPTICPMAGSTSPYTLASTLVLGHAESLFMAALTQILKRGNPFLYAFGPSVMEMRSGHDLYYTMDKVLWKIAAVQLARSYDLPVSAECGGTMTYRYDPQNGMEGVTFMLGAVASGASVLSGFGSGYTAMGMSAEMMVIQEAWMKAARFLGTGIEVDEVHLGLENIKRAGPGGEFLTDDLTLRYMGGGQFFANDLFDHSPCGVEGKSMLERAHERVERLLAGAESPVPEGIREELGRYFDGQCAKLGARG